MAVRDNTDILIAPQAEKIPVAVKSPPRPAELPHKIEDGAGSEVIKIKNANEWYDVDETSWTISAFDQGVGDNPQIQPLKGEFGKWPELHPLLLIDGIVIRVDDKLNLVSQKTLNDIEASDNPHYDIRNNGMVMGKTIGETIPIIDVSTANLKASGSVRDELNLRAGVKTVDYLYESDMVEGVPQGLIDHIHFMFGLPGSQRSEDRFEIYDFGFTKDFGTGTFKTVPLGPDGKVDRSKLNELIKVSKDKVNTIMGEFHIIKEMYYSGKIPADKAKNLLEFRKRAEAYDPYHERPDREYIVKTSVLKSVEATPLETVHSAVSAVATATIPTTATPVEIGTAGGEENALVARWQAYGFTASEKNYLKTNIRTSPAPSPLSNLLNSNTNIVTIGGRGIYIGIQWAPDVCEKARVVGELNSSFFGLIGNVSVNRTKLIEYFGYGLSSTEYLQANNKRKAELLDLADKIVNLEKTSGKIY